MDCFGTCFAHAQTSDVKPPCKRPRSPLQRWRQPLSSPLQAPLKPLQAPFKPLQASSPSEGFKPLLKPLWSHLQALLKPSEGEAPLKPPSSLSKASSPSEGFKPSSSPLEAPFKPLEAPFTFRRLQAPLKPPSSPLEAPLKPSEGEALFDLQTFVPPSPRLQTEGGTSEPAPHLLKGALVWHRPEIRFYDFGHQAQDCILASHSLEML